MDTSEFTDNPKAMCPQLNVYILVNVVGSNVLPVEKGLIHIR